MMRRLISRVAAQDQLQESDAYLFVDNVEWSNYADQKSRNISKEALSSEASDARLVVEFCAKFRNRIAFMSFFENIVNYELRRGIISDAFRQEVEAVAEAIAESVSADTIHSRLSGSLEDTIPNLFVAVDDSLVNIIPRSLLDPHRLVDRLLLGAKLLADAGDVVKLRFFWREDKRALAIENSDGQLSAYLGELLRRPHRFPAELRSIPEIARRLAPFDMRDGLQTRIVQGTQLLFPLLLSPKGLIGTP